MLNLNGKKILPKEKLSSGNTRATRTSEPKKSHTSFVATFRTLLLLESPLTVQTGESR